MEEKDLEEEIQLEYYRLANKLGLYPSYLHVNPLFINKLIEKYSIGCCLQLDITKYSKRYKYMGMEVKRSLDLKEDEFLLSFNKYDL